MNDKILPIVLGKSQSFSKPTHEARAEQARLLCLARRRKTDKVNGIIVSPKGIALCIAGGGKGHDTDKPKILICYE